MTRATVRFLGGVREIGGNKILIEDGPDRVLFDFGPSFDPRFEEYYVDYLRPRPASPVRDLLEFDLIPWIDGLYSKPALGGIAERYRPPEVHGLFVSHAHYDHAGYLKYVDPEIPVHLGSGTKTILDAIDESSPLADFGEHRYAPFEPGRPVRVGGIEVVPIAVDHSVPHAFAFLVRTSAGTVVYTGDFRQHGPRAGRTEELVEAAREEEPSLLIIEGTRAGPDPRRNFSEEGVLTGVRGVLAEAEGPVLVNCYPRDVDRLSTLYRAAVDAGRDLVVPFKTAHLLSSLAGDPELRPPVPGRDRRLRVYHRRKSRYYGWEKPFLDEAVDAEWVRTHGADTLLLLEQNQFTELIDLRPPTGSPFIRSMSEPFSEEDLGEEVFRRWLEHFGLRLQQFHASGHCSAPELARIISEIRARAVFPVHTQSPEAFEPMAPRVVPPVKGVAYDIATGRPLP